MVAVNPPCEGFEPARHSYAAIGETDFHCGTPRKGLEMQKGTIVKLIALCLVLAAIAMLVGGLPWDGLAVTRQG